MEDSARVRSRERRMKAMRARHAAGERGRASPAGGFRARRPHEAWSVGGGGEAAAYVCGYGSVTQMNTRANSTKKLTCVLKWIKRRVVFNSASVVSVQHAGNDSVLTQGREM
eukprot:48747-Prorocentrum_minimum.AAC.1